MNNRNKFLLFFAVCLLSLQSCKKDYFDLNDNPNQVTVIPITSLLSTATHKAGINNYNVASVTNPYVQYTANPTASASTDTYEEINTSSTFDALYYAMADTYDLRQLALQQNSSEYLGVAYVLLAYQLGLSTDLWGDSPFSTAFVPTNLTPSYDKQEDLYKTGMTLLDSAIFQLAKTDATLKLSTTNDRIYGAPMATAATQRTKWLQFAYALKARLLLKVSKTASYSPTAVLAAVDNSFKSNADDAGTTGFTIRNPWANVSVLNAGLTLGGWLSEQFIDQLNGVSTGIFDPRIRKLTEPTVTGTWIGTTNGAGNRPPGNNTVKDENYISSVSPWSGTAAPVYIVTYAELKFIEAEAALAAANPTRAYTAYLAGINANMDKLGVSVTDAERVAYLAAVSVGSGSLTRAMIMREKYVATYLNPEAWNDARRFDYQYKDFTLPVNAKLPTYIRRLAWAVDERSKNGKNVPAAVPLTEKLWWDRP